MEVLTSLGEINKITVDFERAHYDPFVSLHHHAICTKCGNIFDVEQTFDFAVEKITINGLPKVTGYHIDFWGLCSKCNGKAD